MNPSEFRVEIRSNAGELFVVTIGESREAGDPHERPSPALVFRRVDSSGQEAGPRYAGSLAQMLTGCVNGAEALVVRSESDELQGYVVFPLEDALGIVLQASYTLPEEAGVMRVTWEPT